MKWKANESKIEIRPVKNTEFDNMELPHTVSTVYADSPDEFNFRTLQQNLQNCLAIVDNEVMKKYVPSLQNCDVMLLDDTELEKLQQIQFFRISELVYQENEFSVHKLATIFNALSNKPCTLVLMIRSDGQDHNFYLGVRSRDIRYSTGTMRQQLEQSLLGLFPGSDTADYFNEEMQEYLNKLDTGCISSVTCIADYKQDKEFVDNKEFIQGLEKFIYSMQGKPFTAICIANNLEHCDLIETRKEYERIYTLLSPFANIQYNYSLNNSSSISDSDTQGNTETESRGETAGVSITRGEADASTQGMGLARTKTETIGNSASLSTGKSHTTGLADSVNESESLTNTKGNFSSSGINTNIHLGPFSVGGNTNRGISASVSRGKTHGISHTDSVSDSISKNLTFGMNVSTGNGYSASENKSSTKTLSFRTGTQYSENTGKSVSANFAHTKALTDTFGSSQAATLNVQNRSLVNMLQRLEKQMERLEECESIGMWDFAAYFLGESAAEAETAANMYRSLVSGNQSGLEISAVNTWTDEEKVKEIARYVTNFLHPVFCYQFSENTVERQSIVDPTSLVSTNELAIQMGFPRTSVKGLPVIEHALFAQEIMYHYDKDMEQNIQLGKINHLGRDTDTSVELDLQSLTMHAFITGSTGAGKSNTVYQILAQLEKNDVHFLVIEPAKGEYKNIFGNREDVTVYGTNPLLTDLLRINPFSFPEEVHIYEHLDRLVEIFNVCWPMYAAMPAVLKDAIERSYIEAGWDLKQSENKYSKQLFPNFTDVLQQIEKVMDQSQYSNDNKSDYKGALSTRLRSLTNGINGLLFTSEELSARELFDKNVIVDLSRVGSSETKSLIMGLLIMKLQEYRLSSCKGMNMRLNHVTVLEEAHNLLKRTSTEQCTEGSNVLGKSVEMLTNAIAEMRTYGEGFVIADQSPGLLDMAAIRNTNTKIIMRLPDYSDRELVGRAVGLNDEQIAELSKLNKGVAVVYQNDWLEAVLCRIKRYACEEKAYCAGCHNQRFRKNVKGNIISHLIAEEFDLLIDQIDDDVIYCDMPVSAKRELFEYTKTPLPKKLNSASAIAYELFSADSVFSDMMKMEFDYEQQKYFLIKNLTPSIIPFPYQYSLTILCLIAYRNMQLTGSSEIKILLDHLLDEKWKEEKLNDR
ncbi:ATP-binding protein [Schaedlerella arabinosiphila]|uniref:ATP-binding protein n=1 Tax=Schaedlerella arabinosiphila TaxID=2044587 RepID=UPI002557DC70|nr:DUF87 domain-containing protein [Schaedlerella arabinosiphila]